MSILRTMLSGALAAALAAPAMAQTYDLEFGSGGHFQFGYSHSQSLRFDPASARLRPGQALHFHVERIRRGRARRLAPSEVSVRLIAGLRGASLRAQGDGFHFSARHAGRYIIEATRHRGWSASIRQRMTVDVLSPAPVMRVHEVRITDLRSGRRMDTGHWTTMRRGTIFDVQLTPVCARGRALRMPARMHTSRVGVVLHALGSNRYRVHVTRSVRLGRTTIAARAGETQSYIRLNVVDAPRALAAIAVEQVFSCGGSFDAGSTIRLRVGERMRLRASGRTRRGAPVAISPSWSVRGSAAHVDGRGASVILHATRAGRAILTVRDASGVARRITVLVSY